MGIGTFSVRTPGRVSFVNITAHVAKFVAGSGITDGICVVFVPHTTAGITINESADPAVVRDMIGKLGSLVPADEHYTHAEGNSDAHIKASLMGSSVTIPVVSERLAFGTWQGIFLCEFDGPRERTVRVRCLG